MSPSQRFWFRRLGRIEHVYFGNHRAWFWCRGWPLEPLRSGAPWFCGGMRLHVLPWILTPDGEASRGPGTFRGPGWGPPRVGFDITGGGKLEPWQWARPQSCPLVVFFEHCSRKDHVWNYFLPISEMSQTPVQKSLQGSLPPEGVPETLLRNLTHSSISAWELAMRT